MNQKQKINVLKSTEEQDHMISLFNTSMLQGFGAYYREQDDTTFTY